MENAYILSLQTAVDSLKKAETLANAGGNSALEIVTAFMDGKRAVAEAVKGLPKTRRSGGRKSKRDITTV